MKQSLRKSVREKLAAMDTTVAHAKSMAACKRLMDTPEFHQADAIMIYLPVQTEVDVTPIALRGWQEQKIIAAPKLSWDRRHMLPIEIRSLESGLVTRYNGLREPDDGEPVAIEAIDLVLVPAMVFDRRGNRIGHGAGFYDRFLATPEFKGIAAGVGFNEQIVGKVPVHEYDVPVDMLVTDEEILRFDREDRNTQELKKP